MRRRRVLDADEERLWHEVARTVRRRLPPAPQSDPPPLTPGSAPASAAPGPAPDPIAPFRLGERAGPLLTAVRPPLPLAMDAKLHARMTRGKLAPEARIDLHGMTLAEAQPELLRFILNAQACGLRLVLVITGKGRPAPEGDPMARRSGILRHQVPVWLRQAPLGPAVQQVAEAHLRHGGAGALYVYLRRNPR